MFNTKNELIAWGLRWGLTAAGTYLAAHGHDGTAAYISTNADTIIGLVLAVTGGALGINKAVTTVSVPKNDPDQAKAVAGQIADKAKAENGK